LAFAIQPRLGNLPALLVEVQLSSLLSAAHRAGKLILDHQLNQEIALMGITPLFLTPLFLTPLLVLVGFVSLLCAAATVAATQTSSRTTRRLAKRYPRLLNEDAVTYTDVSPAPMAAAQ